MTANAGYHAYATGDVLTAAQVQYNLQNQTTMYFASASARTTALTGVLVEGMVSYIPTNGIEYYNGSAWVSISQAVTALTTKGDLLTYSTQDTRLPVGSDGQTLVANSAATTGLQWASTPSASNPVLNSAMQVWQRGTSIALAASTTYTSGYTADRWQTQTNANQACTISRQATGDTTNLPSIQYNLRYQRNSGQTGTSLLTIMQNFESINSVPFAGKTVTFSFYARAGANYSPTSSALPVVLWTGTGTDQNVFGALTGQAATISQTATLTTTWQRFQYSATLPTNTSQISVGFQMTPTGTAGAADYFEITGVQLDIGSVALPFRTYAGTIQSELAACQRYFNLIASGVQQTAGPCYGYSSARTDGTFTYPAMRTSPTLTITTGTGYYTNGGAGGGSFSTFTALYTTTQNTNWYSGTTSTTIGYGGFLYTNNASASIALSAEL